MIDYGSAFLKVPREVIEAIGRDANALAVYLTILSRVRWDGPIRVNTGRGSIDLDIGQCVLGREEVAAAVGISIRSARTALQTLATLGIIEQQATNRGTTVTLCGFKGTLDARTAERPAEPTPKNRPANDQQNGQPNDQQPTRASAHGRNGISSTHGGKRPAGRPAERPRNDHYQDQDQSPDLSSFRSEPDPGHGGGLDRVQRMGPLHAPERCQPGDGAHFAELLTTLVVLKGGATS